jgi:hypothetical protein
MVSQTRLSGYQITQSSSRRLRLHVTAWEGKDYMSACNLVVGPPGSCHCRYYCVGAKNRLHGLVRTRICTPMSWGHLAARKVQPPPGGPFHMYSVRSELAKAHLQRPLALIIPVHPFG